MSRVVAADTGLLAHCAPPPLVRGFNCRVETVAVLRASVCEWVGDGCKRAGFVSPVIARRHTLKNNKNHSTQVGCRNYVV